MTLLVDSRASSSSSAGGLAQQHYHKALELEKVLLTSIQSKGPFDPNVRILRNSIRELYESIILEDHEFSELHDVEQFLWRLHYTRIEEFRARIKKGMPPAGAGLGTGSSTASAPTSGNKASVRREPVHKILAVFRSFLSEATGFYHDLILKIRTKHGLSQDDLTCNAIEGNDVKDDDKKIAELKRCQLLCHRCLIYLGDLARYNECYGDGDVKNHDWSIAAGFYVKAASLWPASGNPHNQLAVLATYVGDEMLAVYHYLRSLAAETPFLTAKDNLVLLFEMNRHSYLRLVASTAGKPSQITGNSAPVTKGIKGDKGWAPGSGTAGSFCRQSDQLVAQSAVASNATEILKNFRVHVVRLNGILFTRTSLETFPEVHSCVLSELEQLLDFENNDGEAGPSPSPLTLGGIWGTGPNVVLQLISILIFTVHNVNIGPDSHQPTYAKMLQQSAILEHALIATFECAGYLLQQCIKVDDASVSSLLPAVLVIMEWLSCRPKMAMGTEIREKEVNARMFFWKKCVNLLNRFLDEEVKEPRTGAFRSVFSEEDYEGFILWEDHELRGFTPLLPIQMKLDYTKRPTVDLGSKKEIHARVQRLIRAGKVISNTFEGTEKGMHYDVETDRFYLAGDKKRWERKRDGVVLTAETTEEPCVRQFVEPKKNQTIKEQEMSLTKATASGEEEDEEVIVFKPSVKLEKQMVTRVLDYVPPQGKKDETSNPMLNTTPQSSSWIGPESLPQKPLLEMASFLTGVGKLLPEALPSMVPLTSTAPVLSSEIGKLHSVSPKPASFASEVTVSSAFLDSKSENSFHPRGLAFNMSGALDGNLNIPSSGYEAGLVSGSLVDWGTGTRFGMFQNQHPFTSIPTNTNWQPQDVIAGSSLWNPELHKLAAAKGSLGVRPSSSTMGPVERACFMEFSPSFPQNVVVSNAAQNMSEIVSLPAHSMVNSLLDGVLKTKPSSQASKLVTKDSIPGHLQAATQDLSFSGDAQLKPVTGCASDSEKPSWRVANLSSGMRPPPGFGPLPAKPPVSLPVTSAFQSSQPTSSGQPANILVQTKSFLDYSSVDEQVDDYGWLDGYTPLTREISKLAASGQGWTVGSSSYGGLTGGTNPAVEAAASPFSGMKLSDRFSSPPPLPPPQGQAQLQQDLLRKQQMHEQYQQQLLQGHQRQQLQQLYNAQLASQRSQQHQHTEQQQQQQVPQQQPPALQQQTPQSLWPGQNYFVS